MRAARSFRKSFEVEVSKLTRGVLVELVVDERPVVAQVPRCVPGHVRLQSLFHRRTLSGQGVSNERGFRPTVSCPKALSKVVRRTLPLPC